MGKSHRKHKMSRYNCLRYHGGVALILSPNMLNSIITATEILKKPLLFFIYNPQNEMFRLLGTKRSFSQNETFFFSHPYPPTLPFSA